MDNKEESKTVNMKEELVRVITKDGATFLLGAPLPQPVDQEPEPVKVINIELLQAVDPEGNRDPKGDDVFRIVSQADEGSHYEKAGLAIVTTVPYNEATRWDSVVNEKDILNEINEARLNSMKESEEEDDEDEDDDENDDNGNSDNGNDDKEKANQSNNNSVNSTSTPNTIPRTMPNVVTGEIKK